MTVDGVDHVIEARPRDIGGFPVRRVLPFAMRRLVGPFVFFDHMGPTDFAAGHGLDVLPHPHIGLATVTYLFAGEIVHRDSLGSEQTITPGDINWMTAGRGIVHSERTGPARRAAGSPIHGLQLWVALPTAEEERAPEFHHHAAATLPELRDGGVHARLLAGGAYGLASPVATLSPLFYLDVTLDAGARLPLPDDHDERAVYVISGAVEHPGARIAPGTMVVFAPRAEVTLQAVAPSRVVLLGGAALEGKRHIFWNFVSSSRERIEQAKADWKEDRFPKVPGDEQERVPLP